MTDDERLTPELQALLTAERDAPGPDAGARDRVARKLASTLGVTLAAAGASSLAGSGAQAALPKALVGKSLAAKLLVAALVGGVGAGGVAATVMLLHRRAPVAPVAAPSPVAPLAPPSLGAVSPSLSAPSDAPAVAPPPSHHAEPHHAEPHRAEPRSRVGDLSAERAMLAEARAAMQASDAPRALAILDEHARTFAGGQLAEERDAMRVAALWLSGDHEGARRHAAEFARRHPDSLFLPSVQRAVTEAAPPAQ